MSQTSQKHPPAFSLLEVMVALAILSVGLVTLVQVQARSAELAIEGRELTVATMLARGKLYDCQTDLAKKGFSIGDYDEEGNFDDEGYADFFWECHAYKPELPTGEVGDTSGAASAFGLGASADAASGGGANPADAAGMSFLGPVLSQLSTVMGDSIRELVVIVRWGTGEEQREMAVTTHVIDRQAVQQVAAMIQQQAKALGALTGGAGGGAAGDAGSGAGGGAGGGDKASSRKRIPPGGLQ